MALTTAQQHVTCFGGSRHHADRAEGREVFRTEHRQTRRYVSNRDVIDVQSRNGPEKRTICLPLFVNARDPVDAAHNRNSHLLTLQLQPQRPSEPVPTRK